mgnify:CR=1 FL=1
MAIKNNKRTVFVLAAAAIMAVAGYYFLSMLTNGDFAYQAKKIGIGLKNAEHFMVKEISGNRMLAEKNGEIIRIETIKIGGKTKAEAYMKEQTALLDSMFDPQLPPYPEFLTIQTGCDEKYKPQEHHSAYGKYFIMYAGDRLGYGICVDDLITYRASKGLLYCEKPDTLFTVEYFTDKNENINSLINFNNSFFCR